MFLWSWEYLHIPDHSLLNSLADCLKLASAPIRGYCDFSTRFVTARNQESCPKPSVTSTIYLSAEGPPDLKVFPINPENHCGGLVVA